MPRFFVAPEAIRNQSFTLTGSEARHAAVVLRKKVGDVIDLFDGKDLSYQGRIESLSPERVDGVILTQEKKTQPAGTEIILAQALIKGPKWDWLVEKASEIGVTTLVPLITARTVVKPSGEAPQDRWKRIALAAAKQCGRSDVMDVSAPTPFTTALAHLSKGSIALIPYEKESTRTIRDAMAGLKSSRIHILIGPEGGWDPQEVELAVRANAIPVRLGPTLLRSETAGLVAATLAMVECGLY